VVSFQVEREKMQTEEIMSKTAVEKTSMDRTLIRLEEDNAELRQQVHGLQTQLSQIEQEHAQRSVGIVNR
jgi:hypothetical protein